MKKILKSMKTAHARGHAKGTANVRSAKLITENVEIKPAVENSFINCNSFSLMKKDGEKLKISRV